MILYLHAITNMLQLLKLYQWNNLGLAFRANFMYPKSSRITTIMVEWKIKERKHMKKGDKIRFTGEEWEYNATMKGKEYTIEAIDEVAAMYRSDNGRNYFWYYNKYPNDFTLVQAEQNDAPAERDPNTLQEGDIIKFMGAPNDDNRNRRYHDTTVGKEYEIFRVVYNSDSSVSRVRYLDDNGDAISWHPNRYTDMYFFKVMNDGKLYKDDVLATTPTVQDLQSLLDLALLTNDIQWAQDLYQQIQQMEGEHA